MRGWLGDTDYLEMCKKELITGEHVPPESWPDLFTNAYFHRPGELENELHEAVFMHQVTCAVQGMV